MARITSRFTVVYVTTVVVALLFASSPAVAGETHNPWDIVNAAAAANQSTISEFATAAIGSSTIEELNTARSVAHRNLDNIYGIAESSLQAIASDHPEYADEVAEALMALRIDHDDAHAEVEDLYWTVYDALSNSTTTTTTSTTQPPTTTTSTTKPSTSTTTTTKPPVTTTTTTRPRDTTTTSTTTTTVPRQTTTTVDGATPPPSSGSEPPGGSTDVPAGSSATDDVMTAPSVLAAAPTAEASSSEPASAPATRGAMSSMVSDSVSGVLPPALADFTVAPFILVEMLAMTLFDSVRQMLLPFVLISIVMAAFVWSELRRRPETTLQA